MEQTETDDTARAILAAARAATEADLTASGTSFEDAWIMTGLKLAAETAVEFSYAVEHALDDATPDETKLVQIRELNHGFIEMMVKITGSIALLHDGQ